MTSQRPGRFGIRPSSTSSTSALWAKSLLNAVLFFTIFMVLLPWGTHSLLPARIPVPKALGIVGAAVLFLGGLGVWVYCLDVFSRRGRGTPLPMDAPRFLVESGPFQLVRNPIMAGELAVIWAEVLYFASLGILIYAVVITVAAHLMVVYVEEPELRGRFGEPFEDYCQRVPRWLPRLRRRGQTT
jgi:protein-S-isoprenylcysteine O-methyltransferase Ste14